MNDLPQPLEDRILGIARHFAHRIEDREDLAQEGRLAALEALRDYTPGKVPATAYASISARFAMVDWMRREGRPGRRATAEQIPDQAGQGAGLEELVDALRVVRGRLEQLAPRDAIIVRGSLAGWSAEDLGAITGLSADRVRQIRLDSMRQLAA